MAIKSQSKRIVQQTDLKGVQKKTFINVNTLLEVLFRGQSGIFFINFLFIINMNDL